MLLFDLTRLYFATTFGAKKMSRAKSRSAYMAGKLDAKLKMFNDHYALAKIYVLYLQSQSFGYATSQVK